MPFTVLQCVNKDIIIIIIITCIYIWLSANKTNSRLKKANHMYMVFHLIHSISSLILIMSIAHKQNRHYIL